MSSMQFTRVMKRRQDRLEVIQFVLIPLCPMFALGVLIPAARALSFISQVEEHRESYYGLNFEAFDADGSRGAAGWSLFASVVAIISQCAIYASCCIISAKHYHTLACSVTISVTWCFFNAIFLFAGGIASTVYFVENNKLWRDQCSDFASRASEECEDLDTVTSCQIAGGVLAFLSSLLYIAFLCILMCLGYYKNKEGSVTVRSGHSSSNGIPSRGQTNAPLQPRMQPATMPLSNIQPPELPSVQPSAPILEEPSAPPLILPSAPPLIQPSAPPPDMQTNEPSNPSTNGLPPNSKFKSMAPPTYESTLTDPPPYETALTNTS